MVIKRVAEDVYALQSFDWDRRTFDSILETPKGTTYNSFLIKDEKNILIDSTKPSMAKELLEDLESLNVQIDYIVSQHAEQDHSGAIPALLREYPNAKILGTRACKELLENLLGIPAEKIQNIEDGQVLSAGRHKLNLIVTPWVHWPDTMVSYLLPEGILFSCDFFASHFATTKTITKLEEIQEEAKRYYAHIMMPFSQMIQGNLEKLRNLEIRMIAPSHGPIIEKPEIILDLYGRWSSQTSKKVTIAYISMHGSTELMVKHLTRTLTDLDVNIRVINLANTSTGELIMELVDSRAMIIASPTVLTRPHPSVASMLYLVNMLKPPIKYVALIGSYGWGTLIEKETRKLLGTMNIEFLEPVLIKGKPHKEDFERLDKLAWEIKEKIGEDEK
ncbi:MAG TPA: FprA family A-type flavoprotein [Methanothermobacter sp.]|jgi:flavorubredoxin|nr:FprA family A-type flavoprotein [Methanothermobacter tenebrarum]MDD3454734.1 FprA family A-type flavoprotein [Methanobacteriales archaeon]MDI6881591.1 FprA family A-type flavoprotein [Methanothermobacter sp.]MDX9693900.1 FprA family A-type flavoprotein [Methanothermobacter sp.]HHW16041.1 FprA family A-type flavoprotein [Methanothermobacter sp.]HOQ19475.1 FprA family A-type flavoprotein [Methanothermobacter sp.]